MTDRALGSDAPSTTAESVPPQSFVDSLPWARLFKIALPAVFALTLLAALWQAIFLPTQAQGWLGKRVKVPTAQLVVEQGTLTRSETGVGALVPSNGQAIVRLPADLPLLEAMPMVSWNVQRASDKTTVALQWRTGETVHEQPLVFRPDRLAQEVSLLRDPRWMGASDSVRLIVRGAEPLRVGALQLRADSVYARLQLMWDGWFGFHPWKMSDLNFIEAVDSSGTYYFNATLHGGVLGAMLIYGFLCWWRKSAVAFPVIVAILLSGWIIGAARWQVDLAQKTWDNWQRFGGKSLHEKHLAADDHEYYWLIENIRPHLKKANERDFTQPFKVYYNSAERYDSGKLRYYATPHPLAYIDKPPVAGDVFGVVHMPHSYDPTSQVLVLGSGVRVTAEILGRRGAATVFRAK